MLDQSYLRITLIRKKMLFGAAVLAPLWELAYREAIPWTLPTASTLIEC
jgi:hypothetical protein